MRLFTPFRLLAPVLFVAAGSLLAQPTITISTTSLPNAQVGISYLTAQGTTVQLQATGAGGGPYTWNYTSFSSPGESMTDGLNFNANGTITGSPASSGTLFFMVQATNSSGFSNYVNLSINIETLTVTTLSLPDATFGLPYSQQLQSYGGVGTISWSLTCEDCGARPGPPASKPILSKSSRGNLKPLHGLQLPNGLNLSPGGLITGTPTALGNFDFTVYAEDENFNVGMQNLSIDVIPCVPTVTPASPLHPGDVNRTYAQVQFTLTGCPGSTYTFTEQSANPFGASTEPPGLFLSSAGAFSGTPTTAGTFTFLVTLTDQNSQQTMLTYSVTINPTPSITTSSPLPNGPVGVPYSQQIAATGGTPPYTFSMNANPPGITITPAGVLNGTPTKGGTFDFNIGVTDSLGAQTVVPFQVTFVADVSQIVVSPLSLTFNANLNGNAPPTQAIALVPSSGATPPVSYKVAVTGGQGSTPAPAWITVTPTSGGVPAGLVVTVNQGTMAVGSYPATVQISDTNGFVTDVNVTLNVTSVSQQLTVAPAQLNFAARSATPGNLTEELTVASTGAGVLGFTTSVVNGSPWISNVTASSSTTTMNAPVFVQVKVNTNGLAVGAYHDVIQLSSAGGNVQVPVSLFVAASGPILAVDTTGVLFQTVQGGGSTLTQLVKILNLGDPSSTVNWSATLVGGSTLFSLTPSSGTATSTTPGSLTLSLSPNDKSLAAGPYYAMVEITDSNSLNSPQYVTAVLNVEPSTAAPAPALSPVGLFFTTAVGGAAPAAQQVQVNTSSTAAVTFVATASTVGNGTWLSVTPASGSASGQTAGSISVSVNPVGLTAGIYSGNINVSIGSLLQSVNVTFVVQNNGTSSAISGVRPEVSGCSASKLAITETGLANNFVVPAGWPATLIAQLNNDCAAAVTNGSVVASFSNGDQALNLIGDTFGNYSTTWQPGAVNSQMVITLTATAPSLTSATAQLYGGVAANQTPPPTLAPGGTLNNLNPVVGAGLSPGTIAQVYGSGLASQAQSTGELPLPTLFNNTEALVGTTKAPLYYLSNGQINIQIPYETPATQQIPIILSVNNALTLPLMLKIVPATPGVLSADNGPNPPNVQNGAQIIAQHADFTLVSSSSPAKPGEVLVMYLVGMGATNPSVASGAPSPSSPLAQVTNAPTVTVGSQPATVSFAGLSPGFVGLYQINFQVPTSAASGNLEVDVTQNGVAANPTLLPVSN